MVYNLQSFRFISFYFIYFSFHFEHINSACAHRAHRRKDSKKQNDLWNIFIVFLQIQFVWNMWHEEISKVLPNTLLMLNHMCVYVLMCARENPRAKSCLTFSIFFVYINLYTREMFQIQPCLSFAFWWKAVDIPFLTVRSMWTRTCLVSIIKCYINVSSCSCLCVFFWWFFFISISFFFGSLSAHSF